MPNIFSFPKVIKYQNTEKLSKEIEIKIAAFVAEHNIPFNVSDHLTDLIKSIPSDGEVIKKISCDRTKCSAIVGNVLGLQAKQDLIEKMRNNFFSIIIDESTDTSDVKQLAIVIRTFVNAEISDEFFTLLEVTSGTAQGLYESFTSYFETEAIPYKQNAVGFAADGANTMGIHNSFQSLIKKDIPHIFIMKCICHSLALVAAYACKKLPDFVENLVREVYTYLQYSSKRQKEFKNFQNILEIKPHKLLKLSSTRWLSLHTCVVRILEQYDVLFTFFEKVSSSDEKAKAIFEKLRIQECNMYLHFLDWCLPFITPLNIEFQSEEPKIFLLFNKMEKTYRSILSCYIKPEYLKNQIVEKIQYRNPEHFLLIEKVNLGARCNAILSNINFNMPAAQLFVFRTTCLNFYIELASQIYLRFPFQSEYCQFLKNISFLNPKKIVDILSISPAAVHLEKMLSLDINCVDREWLALKGNTDLDFSKPPLEFWNQVKKIELGNGEEAYPSISKIVSYIFCLPHSSATVERIFSAVNLNKNKIRNRLNLDTLSGILRTKNLLARQKTNCFNIKVNDKMIDKHNASMYKKKS